MTVFSIVIDGAAQHGAYGFAAGVTRRAEGGFAVVRQPDLQPFSLLLAGFHWMLPCGCAVCFILIAHLIVILVHLWSFSDGRNGL